MTIDFGRVPTYSAAELERRAKTLLEERCQPTITIPIDIDLIVEKEPGVRLDILPAIKDRFGVAGVVCRSAEGIFTILIDEQIADKNPNFYRFTIAEEYAHVILHSSVINKIENLEAVYSLHQWERYWEIDRNAKRFAAALLMPAKHLVEDARNLYTRLVEAVGFGAPKAIIDRLADRLSRSYQVSPAAMRIRLGEWPVQVIEKAERAISDELDFLE